MAPYVHNFSSNFFIRLGVLRISKMSKCHDSRDSGNDFFVSQISDGSPRFPFLLFLFLFSFPNVSKNENILFLKNLFLFGYPKIF